MPGHAGALTQQMHSHCGSAEPKLPQETEGGGHGCWEQRFFLLREGARRLKMWSSEIEALKMEPGPLNKEHRHK